MGLGKFANAIDQCRELLAANGEIRRSFQFGTRCDQRRCRGRWFAPVGDTAAAECRNIAAARHFDHERVVASGSAIVTRQSPAQADGLDPDDRIGLGVEVRAAAKRLDGDRVGLELVALARQGHFDDERQKAGQSVGVAKGAAADDPIEFLADVVGMWWLRIDAGDTVTAGLRMSIGRSVGSAVGISPRMSIDPGTVILHHAPRWLKRRGDSIDSRARSCHRPPRTRSQKGIPVGKSELARYEGTAELVSCRSNIGLAPPDGRPSSASSAALSFLKPISGRGRCGRGNLFDAAQVCGTLIWGCDRGRLGAGHVCNVMGSRKRRDPRVTVELRAEQSETSHE